ncbi:hypothetical protein ACMC5U_08765 [Deferribacteres bacterium DY0609]
MRRPKEVLVFFSKKSWWHSTQLPGEANKTQKEIIVIFFKEAFYCKQGELCKMEAKDLSNIDILLKAKTMDLWDETKELRLSPFVSQNKCGFISLVRNFRGPVEGHDNSDAHEQRVSDLHDILVSESYRFIIANKYDTSMSSVITLADTDGYFWDQFIFRDYGYHVNLAHDIFGMSPSCRTSEANPYIAVEVIDKVIPSKGTFMHMLDATENLPCLICFDIVSAPGAFLEINEEKCYCKPKYFIYDGSFWKDNARLDCITGTTVQEMLVHELSLLS